MKNHPIFIGILVIIMAVLVTAFLIIPGVVQAGQPGSLGNLNLLQKTHLSIIFRNFSQVEKGRIAFVTEAAGNSDIYSMNYDGSGITRLTTNPASDSSPDWSPDGSKIVFQSNRTGSYEIFVMDADGTDQLQLTSMTKCYAPQWSPNGAKIAFYCRPVNDNIIYTMNPDGSDVFQVTGAAISGLDPSWSPDGSRIAFGSSRTTPGIYVIDADGTDQALLLESYGLGYFSWSPDGSQFALSKSTSPNYNFDLYVYDIDSGITTRITETTRNHNSVDWSPEGRFLVFHSNFEDISNFNIYKLSLNGGTIWRLTNAPSAEVSPDWVR